MTQKSANKKSKRLVIGLVVGLIILAAIFAAYTILDVGKNGKQSYPLNYEDSIVKYAKQFDVDPYFIAAVIKTESGFDKDAVSHAGAVGLMQIMPETGEWIAGKLGEEYRKENLLIPDTNIRYGTWYLQFLEERFNGDLQLVMAAYNAGHNRVAQWLQDPAYSDGKVLKSIPYEETENYVKKVNRAYEKYKEFYEIG